jgi:hypothetical protein
MRRVAATAVVVLTLVVGTAFAASASSLTVRGGILQFWTFEVDLCADDPAACPDPEDPAPPVLVAISFNDVLFNPAGQVAPGQQPAPRDPVVFEAGASYMVAAGTYPQYAVITCPADYAPDGDDPAITYRFDPPGTILHADEPVTHVLCYQKQTGPGGADAGAIAAGEPSLSGAPRPAFGSGAPGGPVGGSPDATVSPSAPRRADDTPGVALADPVDPPVASDQPSTATLPELP